MLAIGGSAARSQPISEESVRNLERVYGDGDLIAVDRVFAPDYLDHDPMSAGQRYGPEGVKQFVAGYRAAFPDLEMNLLERVVEGDTVVLRWAGHGTYGGPRFEPGSKGCPMDIHGTTVTRMSHGKAVEGWSNWERPSLQADQNGRRDARTSLPFPAALRNLAAHLPFTHQSAAASQA